MSENAQPQPSKSSRKFSEEERRRINSNFGCFTIAGVIGTIGLLVAVLTGWTKLAVLFILAPLVLLFTPIWWFLKLRKLESATGGKKPVSVVEIFLRNLNWLFQDKTPLEFAYESLSEDARQRVGSLDDFSNAWQLAVAGVINQATSEFSEKGDCARCGTNVSGVSVNTLAVLQNLEVKDMRKGGLQCGNCQALYCRTCVKDILEPHKSSFTGDVSMRAGKLPDCVCGQRIANSYLWILPIENLRKPYLNAKLLLRDYSGGDDITTVRSDISIWLTDTGVTKGGDITKEQALFVTTVNATFPLQRINERWQITNGAPQFNPAKPEITGRNRWRDGNTLNIELG